jgi:hypothetical protein
MLAGRAVMLAGLAAEDGSNRRHAADAPPHAPAVRLAPPAR